MSRALRLALWAVDMAGARSGADDWLAMADARMAEAAARGAELLLMPEYACEQWLDWAPSDLAPTSELAWMAETAETLLPRLHARAIAHQLALLPGTVPARTAAGAFRNRAPLLLPDGTAAFQDKLCLTPFERDPASWMLEPGDRLRVIRWAGLRLAILVCLDVEQPALAARLQALDLDLVLVPSMTSRASGHARVFTCARARAVELFAAVAAVGCIGSIRREHRPNVSGAACFLPAEEALGMTGVAARLPALATGDGTGPLLLTTLPIGRIRMLRRAAAEVWPGAWSADALAIGPAPAG